jgi:hypothetical protein
MRALFTIILGLLAFLWLVSRCGNDDNLDYTPSTDATVAGTEETDMSPEATRKRILEAEEAKKADAEAAEQLILEEKRFAKSKAGRIYKNHPEWAKGDCERLANNKIWIGMSLDMLKYKRGLPNSANPSNYGNGTQWQWCWTDFTPSCFYDNDDDGKVDSYN